MKQRHRKRAVMRRMSATARECMALRWWLGRKWMSLLPRVMAGKVPGIRFVYPNMPPTPGWVLVKVPVDTALHSSSVLY